MPVLSWVRTKPLKYVASILWPFRAKKRPEAHAHEPLAELQRAIGHRFAGPALLKQALTHKSSVSPDDTKGLMSNERLEFLGDAVLNCLVTEHLYLKHPDRNEGQLSKIKSLIVSRKILGEIAQSIGLGVYMIFGASEEKSGGRNRLSTLSNTFEAVLGAVYLDGGLAPAKRMLERLLFGRINDFLKDQSNINYKSKILEISQRDGFGIPRYVTLSASGPDHAKEFHVRIEIAGIPMGEGIGPNKKIAQQNAAMNATLNYGKEEIYSRLKGDGTDELVSH